MLPLTSGPVTLRRFQSGDVAALQAYRRDPEVARYQSWAPMEDAEAARFIAHVAKADVLDDGQWCQLAIADDQDGLIGDIGVHLNGATGEVELGISLARGVWGQGWGVIAYRAAIKLVFDDPRVAQVLGAADARNAASLKMLERAELTFQHAEQNTYDGELCTDHVYLVTRDQAQARGLI